MDGLTLTSNLDVYRVAVNALVEQAKHPIQTDQDFADAEYRVKVFKSAENKLATLADQVLGEVKDLDEFVKDLRFIREQIRLARLATDKQVKARKEDIRAGILKAAEADMAAFCDALADELGAPLPETAISVRDAMKGKKTVATFKEAASNAVVQAKIEAEGFARTARANKAYLQEHAEDKQALFNDWEHIGFKDPADFQALVKARLADAKVPPVKGSDELSGCNSDLVQVPSKELLYLRQRDALLTALENAGVEKWRGYRKAVVGLKEAA